MKTIVIYKSKTGFARKYAEWIAEALSADIYELSRVNVNMLKEYDTVIFGGGLYAVGIIGVKFITRNVDKLVGKRLVVFATGASPANEKVINDVVSRNFSADHQKRIKFFYLRGGFNYSKLPVIDKMVMSMLKWSIKKKKRQEKELTADELGMLEAIEKSVDFTSKSSIEQIVAYVNS